MFTLAKNTIYEFINSTNFTYLTVLHEDLGDHRGYWSFSRRMTIGKRSQTEFSSLSALIACNIATKVSELNTLSGLDMKIPAAKNS